MTPEHESRFNQILSRIDFLNAKMESSLKFGKPYYKYGKKIMDLLNPEMEVRITKMLDRCMLEGIYLTMVLYTEEFSNENLLESHSEEIAIAKSQFNY